MIKRGTFPQSDLSSLWEVTVLPEGASKVRPLAVYDENGDSHSWDSWEFQGGILRVSFGVDPVMGTLEYEYQVSGVDPVTISQDGNDVTITVNQYSGGAVSDPAVFQ